jgi:hypothetical protein
MEVPVLQHTYPTVLYHQQVFLRIIHVQMARPPAVVHQTAPHVQIKIISLIIQRIAQGLTPKAVISGMKP